MLIVLVRPEITLRLRRILPTRMYYLFLILKTYVLIFWCLDAETVDLYVGHYGQSGLSLPTCSSTDRYETRKAAALF